MKPLLVLGLVAVLQWAVVRGRTAYSDDFLSEEQDHEAGSHYEVYLVEGKKLNLTGETNRRLNFRRWYHNNRPVSERTRRGCQVTTRTLLCPHASLQDAGLYELRGTDNSDRRYIVLSAYVHVKEHSGEHRDSEPVASARVVTDVEPLPPAFQPYGDCFCSGITERCRLATYLYRTRRTYNISGAEREELPAIPALAPGPYVSILGKVWGGNLITSYGGYLSFPVTNECYMNRSEPCVVLVDVHDRAVGHFLSPRHDQRTLSVHMKETSWRVLHAPHESKPRTASPLEDKKIFMFVLSNIRALYVRGRYGSQEGGVLTIDLASPFDEGLGRVNTVEECSCHPGYAGLSCERCDTGYTRNPYDWVCVNDKDLWQMLKRKYNVA